MFSNYLISALRSLKRRKMFAVINVVGLSIGLAACTLIILFVKHEFSYDEQFTHVNRLYRIEATANIPGQAPAESPRFFGSAYDLLPNDYEEIEVISRLQTRGGTVVKGDSSISMEFTYVDAGFLTMFDFPMLEGERTGALDAPTSIVLTEEMAIKHLGAGPWLGRTIVVNDVLEREHKVTGVIRNLPGNTHFDIDFLVSIDSKIYETEAGDSGGITDLNRWNGLAFNVYIKLKDGRRVDGLKATINDWVDKYFPAQI